MRECNCCLLSSEKDSLNSLLVSTVEKASVQAETELSMVRFIYKKAPCRCLKALKSKLKETYGPQFDTCKNNQCKKRGEIDDFFQCSGCLHRYCSEACQTKDWENGKHGGFCKPRSGKRVTDRIDKMCEIFPDVPHVYEQLGEEEKNDLFQFLDDTSIGELRQLMQNMNVDE